MTVVCLGSLLNLATALERLPELPKLVRPSHGLETSASQASYGDLALEHMKINENHQDHGLSGGLNKATCGFDLETRAELKARLLL